MFTMWWKIVDSSGPVFGKISLILRKFLMFAEFESF